MIILLLNRPEVRHVEGVEEHIQEERRKLGPLSRGEKALGVSSLVGITVVIVVIAVITSETTSNTASAAIVVPIAISISAAADINPTIPAWAAIFGANFGFMLPVSTPPNAIVYSSGVLPITTMIKDGAIFDILGAILSIVGVIAMANVVGLV